MVLFAKITIPMLFPNDSRCMTYDEKTQKSHTRSIPSEHKVLIIIELCRNRKSFHGNRTGNVRLPEWMMQTNNTRAAGQKSVKMFIFA